MLQINVNITEKVQIIYSIVCSERSTKKRMFLEIIQTVVCFHTDFIEK